MKKMMILVALVGLLLLPGVGSFATASTQPQLLTGILNKMEKANQDLKSLKAEMVLQKTNSQLGITDTEYGQVMFKPTQGKTKQKLRIDYTKPSKDIIAVDGDDFTFYQPRINRAIRGLASKVGKGKQDGFAQFITIALSGSLRSSNGKYSVSFVKDESVNGVLASVLRLTPKGADSFSTMDIWVNQQNWLPVQLKGVERNGDYTVVTFKNIQLNSNLADSAFAVNLPSGTKIDKL